MLRSKIGSDLQNQPEISALVSDVLPESVCMLSSKVEIEITVPRILNRYSRSGSDQRERSIVRVLLLWQEGLKLSFPELVRNAEGLRGDAYTEQGKYLRTKSDLSTEMIQVNLKAVLDGSILMSACSEKCGSNCQYLWYPNEKYVRFSWRVKRPGVYHFPKSMRWRNWNTRQGTSGISQFGKIRRSQED